MARSKSKQKRTKISILRKNRLHRQRKKAKLMAGKTDKPRKATKEKPA